jgi:hypothetical protein
MRDHIAVLICMDERIDFSVKQAISEFGAIIHWSGSVGAKRCVVGRAGDSDHGCEPTVVRGGEQNESLGTTTVPLLLLLVQLQ